MQITEFEVGVYYFQLTNFQFQSTSSGKLKDDFLSPLYNHLHSLSLHIYLFTIFQSLLISLSLVMFLSIFNQKLSISLNYLQPYSQLYL